jgi:hypothetical protein
MNYLVPMCYTHGYGKFDNCPTLEYIALCHYLWKWLLTVGSKVLINYVYLQQIALTTLDMTT